MRLLALATHPIQYHAPWFHGLAEAEGVDFEVWFGARPDAKAQGVGFEVAFEWDFPILDGYAWRSLAASKRRSPRPDRFAATRVRGLTRALREARPDVVLLTGWESLFLIQGLLAARRAGVPRLVRGESNGLRPRSPWVRAAHRRLLAAYDAFLVIGAANRDFYRSYGIDAKRLFSTPYFVDNARFREQSATLAPQRQALREGWKIDAGATTVLFAGKLVDKKRPLDLMHATARARSLGTRLHLLVVGDGPLRGELENAAQALGIAATFTGFLNQTEIARAYVTADLLALPSDAGETWGLVVNEAMACGLPAIVSDRVGCGPDLIVEGKTGWTYPCGDVERFGKALAGAAGDPQRLVRMGTAARQRLIAGYSVERAVAGTLEACEHLLAGRVDR